MFIKLTKGTEKKNNNEKTIHTYLYLAEIVWSRWISCSLPWQHFSGLFGQHHHIAMQ